jgi:mono/diheme cytochrome c family protein
MRSVAAIVAIVVLTIPAFSIAQAAGDPGRGAALHEACLGCHGTELYVPPKAKVKTLSALKKEVDRWNDRYNPKFSKQEIEDLVAYLNRDFYKFAK